MKYDESPDLEWEEDESLADNLEPVANTIESPTDAAERTEATRPYPPPATAVPMVQPWRCTRCQASGELECFSSDNCLYCWEEIARVHAKLSPDCQPAKFLLTDDWRQKPKTSAGDSPDGRPTSRNSSGQRHQPLTDDERLNLADEDIPHKFKDPKRQREIAHKYRGPQ